ncbi:hypothetical protein SCLCIDRAFT_14522 [Scleroderma citrinum Foug A]|uniref:Uncharacterized protein n=1 Tax=Scleroderma citrinum Foug A TaxID=1036808 RepID=A0A0C2ZXG9_9AGAM|nr:hypothetical protein SCLCIDRAFT_14522 [Scleroderma citrinum Foug A]
MMGTGFYLGDNLFHDRVTWAWEGCATRLAIRPEGLDSAKQDLAKYPSSPPPEDLALAPICAVVKISSRDFWLTTDAGYRGPSQIWKDFSEVKASCACEQPDMVPFKDDFSTVTENLHWLQDEVTTSGFPGKKGLFIQGNEASIWFKVCHKLFEVSPLIAGEDKENKSAADGLISDSSVFAIENWPTFHDVAASALDSIKDTHRVHPILAYGMDGKLIKPQAYRHQLDGALVELYFTLSHWAIGERNGSPGNDLHLILL